MAAEEWVGKALTCTLKGSSESIKGEVFTYDKSSDSLVLKDHAVKDFAAYRFLKGKDLENVKLAGNTLVPDPRDVPAVSDATIER
jgi:hypothetical protein